MMGEEALISRHGEAIYVAVGTDLEKEMRSLLWVMKRFPGAEVVLVHVHVLSKWIPMLGTKILASQASEDAIRKHRKKEKERMNEIMSAYITFCEQRKVQVKAFVTLNKNVDLGIRHLVAKHHIKKLVLGSRSMSKQEALLCCCQVFLVSDGKHISTSRTIGDLCKTPTPEQEEGQEYWSALSHDPHMQVSGFESPPNEPVHEDEIVNHMEGDSTMRHGRTRTSSKDAMLLESMKQQLAAREELEELRRKHKQAEEEARLALEKMALLEQELEALRKETTEAMRENLLLRIQQLCTEFSASEVMGATNNCHHSQKIGEGGYGPVYRGIIRHNHVAIKMLNPESKQGPSEFRQEVVVLSRSRHPNIVILYGMCSETSSLVYEYLPNGNLEERLSCKNDSPHLSCWDRIRIISEQHSALVYLHSCEPHAIVHADLKLHNILLDANNVSRLGDFGTARLILCGGSDEATIYRKTNPMGTMGYMDPMFLTDSLLTPQSDVYSFGIIILRLLTKLPVLKIREKVEEGLRTGKVRQLLDISAGQWPVKETEKLLQLALRCCSIERSSRPSLLSEEWKILETLRAMAGKRSNSRK